MPSFFEGFLSLYEDDWVGGTTFSYPQPLFVDSESLSLSKNIEEKPMQLAPSRVPRSDSLVFKEAKPEGNLVYQFRSSDILKTLYSHFQLATFEGTSPYRYGFYPKPRPLDWEKRGTFVQGAYSVSSDGQPYTVSVLKKLFDTSENGGTNSFFFKHGICNKLRFQASVSDDAKVGASFKFTDFDAGTPVSGNPGATTVGSYATTTSFFSWVATVTIGGQAIPISSFALESDQNFQEFSRVGKQQPENYQLSSYSVQGNFSLDIPSDSFLYVGSMFSGQSFAFLAMLRNGTSDQIVFDLPHCKRMPFEFRQGETDALAASIPFKAYENAGTYPFKVTVLTEYAFEPFNMFGDALLGTRTIGEFELYDAGLGARTLSEYTYYSNT